MSDSNDEDKQFKSEDEAPGEVAPDGFVALTAKLESQEGAAMIMSKPNGVSMIETEGNKPNEICLTFPILQDLFEDDVNLEEFAEAAEENFRVIIMDVNQASLGDKWKQSLSTSGGSYFAVTDDYEEDTDDDTE